MEFSAIFFEDVPYKLFYVFRSDRISSVYIVSKWVTLLSKLVNFECVRVLEC